MVEQNNVLAVILTVSWVLIFLGLSEGLAHLNKLSKENARKMIHISVGNVIFFIPIYESKWIAAAIPFTFIFGNYFLSPNSPIEKIKLKTFAAGHSNGTIYYPIALTIAVLVFFDKPQLLIASFFPLVYGDGLAAIVGPNSQSRSFKIWGGDKTTAGTLALFFASLFSVCLGMLIIGSYISNGFDNQYIFLLSFLVASIGTILELISPKGMDNLIIPLGLVIILLI